MQHKIPLIAILAMTNVRGIIHQCGQNTLTEALYAGVPMICVPFLGDQYYNASLVEYMGYSASFIHAIHYSIYNLFLTHIRFAATNEFMTLMEKHRRIINFYDKFKIYRRSFLFSI
uniref:glucuronosyltransferase n=1 Tax=Ditylenchus dipsaci TaxID=166011 RepID=A0A915D8N2_9BILA